MSSAFFQAGTLILLARNTTIEEFGKYSVVLAAGAIATGVLGFGLAARALRLPPAEADEFRSALIFGSAGQSIGALGVVLAIFLPQNSWSWHSWLLAGAIYTAGELYGGVAQNLLFGEERTARASATLFARRLIPFTALVAGLAATIDPFIALASGVLASAAVVALCVGRVAPRPFRYRRLVLGSRHYWLSNIWSMLQQLDVPIFAAFFGSAPTASYAAAFRLASPVHIVTSVLVSVSVPAITRAPSDEHARKLARRALAIGAGYALLIVASAPLMAWLGPLVLGSDYAQFAWVFPLLFVASAVSVANQLLSAVLYAAGDARLVSRFSLLSTLFGVGVMLVGGAVGNLALAFAGTVATQIVLLAQLIRPTRRYFRGRH